MNGVSAYEDDVYAWAYEQVDLLRRLAETNRELSNALDIENICEEIEGVARTELREAESFLRLLLLHLIKIVSAPEAAAVPHWRAEAKVFQDGFQDAATRTILRKLRVDRVWHLALEQAATQLELEGGALLDGLLSSQAFNPGDLAVERFDIDDALDRLHRVAGSAQPSS